MVGVFLTLTFLAHQTLLSADAMYADVVSPNGLAASDCWSGRRLPKRSRRARAAPWIVLLNWTPAVSLVVGVVVYLVRPRSALRGAAHPGFMGLRQAVVALAEWFTAGRAASCFAAATNCFLRKAALHTWRYFAEFSNQEHNWLVPDNVRETPALCRRAHFADEPGLPVQRAAGGL